MKEKATAFAVGAAGYPCIEILARGHTHWSMALLGGACVLALVVNLALGWQVWDYSREFGNVLGQICPLYSFFWFLLCLPVFVLLRLAARRKAKRASQA